MTEIAEGGREQRGKGGAEKLVTVGRGRGREKEQRRGREKNTEMRDGQYIC